MGDPLKNYPSASYYRLLAKSVGYPQHQDIHKYLVENSSWHVRGSHRSITWVGSVGRHREDTHIRRWHSWLDGDYEEWLQETLKELPPPRVTWESWHGPVLYGNRDVLLFYINGHQVTMEAWTAHENGE